MDYCRWEGVDKDELFWFQRIEQNTAAHFTFIMFVWFRQSIRYSGRATLGKCWADIRATQRHIRGGRVGNCCMCVHCRLDTETPVC